MSSSSLNNGLALVYDAAGNVIDDGNTYLYDAEGRICAVASSGPLGGATLTGYLYDADGTRVAKGTIQRWGTCDPAANGFQPAADYILGPGGQQLTEMAMGGNGQMAWKHTNVWAGGTLLATYDADGLHYHLTDWLGTRRVQTGAAGAIEDACASLPFGDSLSCIGPTFTTEHHFTGREHDIESGNDYFGARYYASSMGRFMSPDWSAKVEAIPYAALPNPQTLNLYSYGLNNPLSHDDPSGHASLEYERAKAVRLAWEQERQLVQKTGTGTYPWTAQERAALLAQGKVSGFQGHHINSVNGHEEMAGDPNNIKFVKGGAGNLAEHGGDFQNPTEGPLINRSAMLNSAVSALMIIDMAVNTFGAYEVQQITGVHEGMFGGLSIADPSKAAVTLDGLAITVDAKGKSPAETLSIHDGQYTDYGTGRAVDSKTLQGRSFQITPTS